MAGFKVTRISEGPVKPASATPEETRQSWRGYLAVRRRCRLLGAGEAPAVIRAALAKALAFFYPLAGRIMDGEQPGRPAIRCTTDGVYFAEAEADCNLEDVRFLEQPLLLPKEDLVSALRTREGSVVRRARSGHARAVDLGSTAPLQPGEGSKPQVREGMLTIATSTRFWGRGRVCKNHGWKGQ
ncbi:HXXXD-type acyl-transferase family protein [Zea mays]|uniref:HXXXD-type acyl-transferase family protein n=1 Tax=Zea mays TaxID=4577 RepID=A0A1D6I3K3_MAIZE|nr:HXXXD-type acyl-transferase family protein [Zea mays]